MKRDALTDALPRLDVGMIYGVVSDAGSSTGSATEGKEQGRKLMSAPIFEYSILFTGSPTPPLSLLLFSSPSAFPFAPPD